jgi:hypothetical protein
MEILVTTKMYDLFGFNDEDDLEIETIVLSQKNRLSFIYNPLDPQSYRK